MGDILLDTTVAVDLLHGHAGALSFARKSRGAGRVLVHTVVVAELHTGAGQRRISKRSMHLS